MEFPPHENLRFVEELLDWSENDAGSVQSAIGSPYPGLFMGDSESLVEYGDPTPTGLRIGQIDQYEVPMYSNIQSRKESSKKEETQSGR